jgi:lipopolysaccharide transport system ATP-binding protein
MSSRPLAIQVEGLAKCYHTYARPRDRLKQAILPRLQTLVRRPVRSYGRAFWALNGVSLEIPQGETLGIIGRNGSGKSTLLQIICGTLSPTAGRVVTVGRVAALLELGSGFNLEFTGRENVNLSAALLGLRRAQIDERFDAIAAFAEIGDFIDLPVKTYSSGMFVRLAFAVIAHVDADILVVDEALSVGDAFFAQKCVRFFQAFRERGGTTLLVSHDTATVVKLCDRVVWLDKGRLQNEGDAETVCRRYLEQMYSERSPDVAVASQARPATAAAGANGSAQPPASARPALAALELAREFWAPRQAESTIVASEFNRGSDAFGLGGAQIVDVGFFDDADRRLASMKGGQETRLSVFIACKKTFAFPAVGITLKDRLGQAVFWEGTSLAFEPFYVADGVRFRDGDLVRVDFIFKMPVLIAGDYALTVAVAEGLGHDHVQHHLLHEALVLKSIGGRLLHGIAGFSDLQIRIAFLNPQADLSDRTAR